MVDAAFSVFLLCLVSGSLFVGAVALLCGLWSARGRSLARFMRRRQTKRAEAGGTWIQLEHELHIAARLWASTGTEIHVTRARIPGREPGVVRIEVRHG
jgi:hypothetical protein